MVSTGIRNILHSAAVAEAHIVFIATGKSLVVLEESSRANTPELAAVSPNLESGPLFIMLIDNG